MTIGEKIYILRTQAGLSQERFAEKIGVSRQSVSKWETSVVIPDTEYVVNICKVLCISTDSLLLEKDIPTPSVERSIKYPDPEIEKSLHYQKALSLTGLIFSIVCSLIGMILCSIAVAKEKKTYGACTHMTVIGLAISIANIFMITVILAVVLTLSEMYGGILQI